MKKPLTLLEDHCSFRVGTPLSSDQGSIQQKEIARESDKNNGNKEAEKREDSNL